ncbi:MAG: GyrI-like domain-containing protein [Anaerolineales bacterium]|nr:GyrI-like domain-containing protein [Anaerolineales bacterium]
MSKLDVKIVELPPMRMVSAHGFGTEPEKMAWEKLLAFALAKGLRKESELPQTFGFNNPNPSKGSPNYGYELWIPVADDVMPEGDLRVVNFEGGLYGVTQFKDLNKIGQVWQQLVKWREGSKYKHGHHQWLEEQIVASDAFEELEFNLYLPITE